MIVALGARWLKIQTRWLNGSKRIPSGPPCTSMVLIRASVLVSNIVTGIAAGEAVAALRVHCRAARIHVGDLAD